jgi:predicted nucleotidyltransferase component of viral defense system
MTLHTDTGLFQELIKRTAGEFNINPFFVEKDYWITQVLQRLSKSKYANEAVFKGGTSLSKGYNLVERFSEDVDVAIINNGHKTGNEIKTIIRSIEKEITADMREVQVVNVTSKGSRFRKSVFEYTSIERNSGNNKLIVEINSFANPFPFQQLNIKSMLYDFLAQTGYEKYIEQYDLEPFTINVLNKEQTLMEKMVSLIRFSFSANAIESIKGKIRHFYDLYFLMQDKGCAEFVASASFKEKFNAILQHDRELFEEPEGWQTKAVATSPLLADFAGIWEQLKSQYQTELAALAYRPVPNEKNIAAAFTELTKRIQ